MIFTQKFNKSLLFFLLGTLLVMLLQWPLTKINNDSSWLYYLILYPLNMALNSLVLWGIIYYLTKDLRSAITGFLITVVGSIIAGGIFVYFSGEISYQPTQELINKQNIFSASITLVSVLAMGAFGKMHFKNLKGILLGLIPLVGMGTYRILYSSLLRIHELVNNLLPYNYRVEVFDMIKVYQFLLAPYILILFWWLYTTLKENHATKSLLFQSASVNRKLNKLQFSLLFWFLRVIFIAGALYASQLEFQASKSFLVIYLITGFSGLYILFSIYRNFLLGYLLSFGNYPSWLYFGLNIPVINFFAWLTLMIKKPVEELDKEKMMKQYDIHDKNISIKKSMVIMAIIGVIYSFLPLFFGELESVERPLTYLLSIGILIWFFADHRMTYIMSIVLSLLLLFTITEMERYGYSSTIINTSAFAGMLTLIAYYPLFHFDKMEMRK